MTTITTEKIEELRGKASKTTTGFMMMIWPEELIALLDLAQRAMVPQPQGQALPELPPPAYKQQYVCTKCGATGEGTGADHSRLDGSPCAYMASHHGPWFTADQMRAYASQLALPAGLVPEGWKMVPVEPTREMKIAGDHAGFWCGDKWKAMCAAAPTAPDAQAGVIDEGQLLPTPPDVRPDTVMAKPMPINALWDAIGVYCEAVIGDELAACGIGDKVDPRIRIGAAKRLIGLIGDRTDHDEPAYPANRLHKDAHRTPAVAQPVADEREGGAQ